MEMQISKPGFDQSPMDRTFSGPPQEQVGHAAPQPSLRMPKAKGSSWIKRKIKKPDHEMFLSQIFLFIVIITILTFGYQPSATQSSQSGIVNAIQSTTQVPTVDQVASINVAYTVASTGNFIVANNVKEVADSVAVKTSLAQSQDTFLTKPSLVDAGQLLLGVTKYTAVNGDTAATIAAKFGLTDQTIRWANNLTSDTVSPGQQLLIPAVNGVVYTVKAGDTAQSIASEYQSNANEIIAENDAEISGLQPGEVIVVPNGILPADQQPGAAQSTASTSAVASGSSAASGFAFGTTAVFGGDDYAFGYCTYWAALRREQIGDPVPNNWGNASTWADGAEAMGLLVNHTPSVGAIMQTGGGYGGYGHVAFVEKVNSDGSWTVSEMNYSGWDVVDERTLPAADASQYNFIH
jgi:surface antigen